MQPFNEIDFKHTDQLSAEYRQLNHDWKRWQIGDEIDPDENLNFCKTLNKKTKLVENEILKYLQVFDKEKMSLKLNDFVYDLERNIELYEKNENEINKVHETKRHNWYKVIYDHSKYIVEFILDKYIVNPDNVELENLQTKDKITAKQQILILHYIGTIDSIEIDTNTGKGKLLSFIINRSEKNTVDSLTYFDRNSDINPKTLNNLIYVKEIFEEIGMTDIVSKESTL